MLRSKLILLVTVVLALVAGVTVGRLSISPTVPSANLPSTRPERAHRPSWPTLLALTPDQVQKVSTIWTDVRPKMEATADGKKELEAQRVAAIAAIFSPSQLSEYDNILQEYRDKQSAMDKVRQGLLDEANAQTRSLLDDNQKKKWDELVKQQHAHGRSPEGMRLGTRASNATTNANSTVITATTQP